MAEERTIDSPFLDHAGTIAHMAAQHARQRVGADVAVVFAARADNLNERHGAVALAVARQNVKPQPFWRDWVMTLSMRFSLEPRPALCRLAADLLCVIG